MARAKADTKVQAQADTKVQAQELTRANTITVQAEAGVFKATFRRTHRVLATILETQTTELGWVRPEGNSTAQREAFRVWLGENAPKLGFRYEPQDMRDDRNKVRPTYTTTEDVQADVDRLIRPDVEGWLAIISEDMGVAFTVRDIRVDGMIPLTQTSKGTDLTTMGIVDGRYEKSGNMAWFAVDVAITIGSPDTEHVLLGNASLVSGQLCKPRHIGLNAYTKAGLRKELEEDLKADAAETK